jgi:hypothetical protein
MLPDTIRNILDMIYASDANFRLYDSNCIGQFPAAHSIQIYFPHGYKRLNTVLIVSSLGMHRNEGFCGRALRHR